MRYGWRLVAAIAAFSAATSVPVSAATCPAGSEEVYREETGSRVTVKCACLVGLALVRGRCVEPAKLDRETYDALVGYAFADGKAIRDYLRTRADWPLDLVTHVALAVSRAEQGFTAEALGLLRAARERVPGDGRVAELIHKLDDLERIRWRNIRPGRLERGNATTGLSPATAAKTLSAHASLRKGDYDDAAAHLSRAVREQPADQGLRDALTAVSQIKEARSAHGRPDFDRERVRRLVPILAAHAAWRLAYILDEGGSPGAAIDLLEESRRLIPRDAADDHHWLGQLAQVYRDRARQGAAPQPGPGTLDFTSKTDAMFDALDYGRQDWSRSIGYLDRILTLYPAAQQVRAARDELAAIAATAR